VRTDVRLIELSLVNAVTPAGGTASPQPHDIVTGRGTLFAVDQKGGSIYG